MDRALLNRYVNLPTTIVSDVLRSAGAPHQVLHHSLQRFGAARPFAAPAFCVRGERVLGAMKASDDRRFELYERFPDGAVLVLDSGGYEPAVVFGENVALALKMQGCMAIVTDGGIRDRDAFSEMQMAVWAKFVTPLSSGKQWITTQIDVPVTLPGQSSSTVTIYSGDIVHADSDGVVIVPGRGAVSILEDAEVVAGIESETRRRLKAGEKAAVVYGDLPRFSHVRKI